MRLTFFDPGQLRQPLHLQQASETPDGLGGFDVTWNDVAFVWGHVAVAGTRIEDFAARRLEEQSHTITIRYRDGVRDGQRFQDGVRNYRILSVADMDGTRRYLTCRTREERP